MQYIFVPNNCPSSKNSKIFTGRFLVNNKQTARYIKATKQYWIDKKEEFLSLTEGKEKPYKIALFFVRDSKRRFDANNASQIVMDLMVQNGWIEDDNMYEVWPVYIGFEVDKSSPGVYISVLDKDYEEIVKKYSKSIKR